MINFTNDDINKNSLFYDCISSELENLNLQIECLNAKKQALVTWANNLTEGIDTFEKNTDTKDLLALIENLKESMTNININIALVTNLISTLKQLISDIDSFSYKGNMPVFLNNLTTYNIAYLKNQKQILENNLKTEKFTQTLYSYSSFSTNMSENNISLSTSGQNSTSNFSYSNDIDINDYKDNNNLIISEIKGKVFLPYKISDLEKILKIKKGEYKDIYDLINKKYILPLAKYKNSSISRFREAFNLMKTKEKSSFLKALELALELTFKYNLHPAIISACGGLDELDVYLDCLEENELDNFHIFEIKFEVLPFKKK